MKLALVAVLVVVGSSVAAARDTPRDHRPQSPCERAPDSCKPRAPERPAKTINIGPLELGGKVRSLSLLEFIERVNEELESATLEKKSFVPAMVRSIDEAQL